MTTAEWPCFEVQITLHVKAISAGHANELAASVLADGREGHPNAYASYIEDVIQLTNPQAAQHG